MRSLPPPAHRLAPPAQGPHSASCRLIVSALMAGLLSLLPACRPSPKGESTPSPNSTATPLPTPPPPPPVPAEIWKEFDSQRAFTHVQRQVECGPRPAGSPALEEARIQIEQALRTSGWTVERQTFEGNTPRGPLSFTNLIARFPEPSGTVSLATQRALVASHYDTKRFSTITFTGANDGASSTGALLELARTLALDPALATQIELVFFDGEEALQQFTETDGLYGSQHYARKLRSADRAKQFQFALLWDMIGDRQLGLTLPQDSPRELLQSLFSSAEALSLRPFFRMHDRSILDDHVPLQRIAGIPSLDLIDFDYPAWHTADDSLDQLSPESLRIVGSVTLHLLKTRLNTTAPASPPQTPAPR